MIMINKPKVLKILLIIYAFAVLYITVFSRLTLSNTGNNSQSLFASGIMIRNLIRDIVYYGRMEYLSDLFALMQDAIMNILLFLPLGYLLPGCYNIFKNYSCAQVVLSGFSLIIEVLQYTLNCGFFDLLDILFNSIGGLFGWMLFVGLE